jgi:integrase
MARKIERLSPSGVEKETKPGMYADGAGLYLLVGPTGAKSWIYRFMLNGKAREMGLGPFHTIGLADARKRALDARRQRLDGTDPLQARKDKKAAAKLEQAKAITFKACAEQYIKAHRAGWRNDKHAAQWGSTLTAYAYPTIGALPVAGVDTGLVTKILTPIWATKSETATRVRGRIESILDYATTHGWRTGENPARWKGHLDNVLPKRSSVRKVEHHAALPWGEIEAFLVALREEEGVSARALEFAILTAARTGELIGARWSEVDLQAKVWTVPPERMKAKREHRVPLSAAALAVLDKATEKRADKEADGFLFPGGKVGAGLSNMALLALLRRMKRDDLTAHGFRSTFRDWAAETGQPDDIAEAALAHVVGDKTVVAYQRGDLLERRRKLMDAWAAFCSRVAPATGGNVVTLRAEAVA